MNSLLYLSSAELLILAGNSDSKKKLTEDLQKNLEKGNSAATSFHVMEKIYMEFYARNQFAEYRSFHSVLESLASEILRPHSGDLLRAADLCEMHGLDFHSALDAVLVLQGHMKIRKDHPAAKLPGMEIW